MPSSNTARMFIVMVALAGFALVGYATMSWKSGDALRFVAMLVLAVAASRLKLSLPGLNSSFSMNLPFILIAIVELSFAEAIAIAAVSTAVQCIPSGGKTFKPVQFLFNVCNVINASAVGSWTLRLAARNQDFSAKSVLVVAAAAGFLIADTVPVAMVIGLSERHSIAQLWRQILQLTFPYFVASAGVAAIVGTATHYVGWKTPLLVLPVMFGMYRSYSLYFGKLKAAVGLVPARAMAAAPAGD